MRNYFCVCAALTSAGFAASRRLAGFYGARDARSVLHEGENESVFVTEVADRALLCVIFSGHDAPGLITRWAASAAHRLAEHYGALTEARVV